MCDYNPPRDEFGIKEECRTEWKHNLAKYKTLNHDPNWVYMYAFDDDGKKPLASVVYDRFPKAQFHLLVLPMNIDVDRPEQFQHKHLNKLVKIHKLAQKISKDLQTRYNIHGFLIGYHASPSMSDLHLHIVSDDLISDYLKRKEHYNSFTHPEYFLTPSKVENDLRLHGIVHILNKIALKNIRKEHIICHKCNQPIGHFNKLKNHLNNHSF